MRTQTGTATSTKTDKTVVITVHTYKRHPKYFKQYRTTKKFHAHDENNICQEGDEVTIAEHRPLSKLKRWKVIEVNGKKVAEEKSETTVKTSEKPTES